MRYPRHSWVSVILLALLLTQSRAAAPASVQEHIRLPFTEHTLKNGMRFLIVERHDSPSFAAYLRFQVGSANEAPGFSGLAHLLEHMMFKGTTLFGTLDPGRELPLLDKIDALHQGLQVEKAKGRLPGGKSDAAAVAALEKETTSLEAKQLIVHNELWEIYQRNGAVRLNASTSYEGTQYFVSFPGNRLELWALLESDRMRNPVFREFYTERDVVQEERRQRVDTSPRGQLWEAALATAFVALPYRHPYLAEDHSLPVLDVSRVFRARSPYETSARPGVAQFTASQLRNGGTTRRTAEALNEEPEVLGASIEASASAEAVLLSLSGLAKDTDHALELLAEVIRQPAFDEKSLQIFRGRVVEDLRRLVDDPVRLLAREFTRTLYTEAHPLGRPLTPAQAEGLRDHYLDTLLDRYRTVTVADVQRVARQYLHPDAATILVIGDPAKFEAAMVPFGPVRRLPEESPG